MRCNASRSGSDGTDSRSAETAKGTLGCGSESGIVTVLFHGNYFGRRNLQLCGCRLVYHRGRCGAASFRYGVRKRTSPSSTGVRLCGCGSKCPSGRYHLFFFTTSGWESGSPHRTTTIFSDPREIPSSVYAGDCGTMTG